MCYECLAENMSSARRKTPVCGGCMVGVWWMCGGYVCYRHHHVCRIYETFLRDFRIYRKPYPANSLFKIDRCKLRLYNHFPVTH